MLPGCSGRRGQKKALACARAKPLGGGVCFGDTLVPVIPVTSQVEREPVANFNYRMAHDYRHVCRTFQTICIRYRPNGVTPVPAAT